jgi:hypothetical protein
MADGSDNGGLGVIVGILVVVVVLIIAGVSFGPNIFGSRTTHVTIEAPKAPAPAPQGG